MEDTYKVENGGRFVAVFDGHGGADVSTILKERLYELYSEELVKKHWEQQNQFGVERKEVPSKSCHIAALQRGLADVHGRAPAVVSATGSGIAASIDPGGLQRRSSSALPTTLTLDKAIAAPASTGLKAPKAASGMPTTL